MSDKPEAYVVSSIRLRVGSYFPLSFGGSVALMYWDRETGEVSVNRKFADLLGYPPETDHIKLTRILTPDDSVKILKKIDFRAKPKAELTETFICRFCRSDQSLIWLEVTVSPCFNEDQPTSNYASFRDLMDSETHDLFIEDFANSLPGIVFSYTLYPDKSHYFSFVSAKTQEFFGINHRSFIDNPDLALSIIYQEDRSYVIERLEESRRARISLHEEFRTKIDGRIHWFEARAIPKVQANGSTIWNGIILSINDRKLLEQELKDLANKDFLTNIYNRRYLNDVLIEQAERCRRYGEQTAVILIDLDNFKGINDLYGHDVGDKVLIAFCNLVKQNIRSIDVFGRIGGEEFLLLLPNSGVFEGHKVAQKLLQLSRDTDMEYEGRKVRVTFSAGITGLYGGHAQEAEVLKHADQLLYEAKSSGRNCVKRST